MQSFYGGRRGQSFELVRTYPSIVAMSQDFTSPSCTVYYGQYVTIDSKDSDRGKIYKRTGNLGNGLGGAVLVGTLPSEEGIGSSLVIKAYNSIQDGQDLNLNTTNGDLVDGSIQEDYLGIRYKTIDNPETNKTETQLGLKIPYNVINWYIDPKPSARQVQIEQEYKKPFHQAYLLTSPVALNGDKITQLDQVTNDNLESHNPLYENPSSSETIETLEHPILAYRIEKEISTDIYTATGQDYEIFSPKVQGLYESTGASQYTPSQDEFKIFGKTYYIHSLNFSTNAAWYKLCDFEQSNITYDEDTGIITIIDQNGVSSNVYIRQVKDFQLNEQGYISMKYIDANIPVYIEIEEPTGNPNEQGWYEKVNSIYILTEDTSVIPNKTYYQKSYEHTEIINGDNPIQWITDISYDNLTENLVIAYNTGVSQAFPSPVNSVSKMQYDKNTGKIYVTYTKPEIIDRYELIEGNTPIEDFSDIYEIAQSYYQDIEDKIQNGQIVSYEEYKAEVLNICETFKGREGLYVLTQDQVKDTYSYTNPETSEITTWNKIYFNQDGQITIPATENIGTIRSVVGIDYTDEGIIIEYNTGERELFDLNIRGVDDIYYDDNQENIIIKYTDGDTESLELAIKVTSIRFNSKNQLVFKFNNNTEITTSKSIEYPDTIEFNNESQKLELIMNTSYKYTKKTSFDPDETNPKEMGLFEYNSQLDYYFETEDTTVVSGKDYFVRSTTKPNKEISPALNYIQDVQINPNTYELLILFSDPEQQGEIKYEGRTGYKSLGYIKDQSGIFITEVLDSSIYNPNYGTIEKAILSLNELYPDGRNGNPHECVAVGGQYESKTIFAFDDINKTWYMLGRFSGMTYIAAATEEDYLEGSAIPVENLPAGGMWYIIRNGEDDYAEYLERYGVYWEEY